MLLDGTKVFVGQFISRKDRQDQKVKPGTNVYINNIDENVNDKKLYKMFEKYEIITSCKVCKM